MSARTQVTLNNFSIPILASSTPILPATFGRNFLLIKNNGSGDCAVNLIGGTAAIATRANIQLASGQQLKFEKNVPQNAINAISASTSQLTIYSDDAPTSFWLLGGGTPASVDLDFQHGRYFNYGLVSSAPVNATRTVNNGGSATDLISTSALGDSFTTFADNTARITTAKGLLAEEARTNQLLNSTTPNTQTTGSLANGTYQLWVNGTGTATSSAGTAVGAGFGAASQGTPNVFTISTPGTVVVTVAGALNAFQLEAGTWPSSLIITGGSTATRNIDVVTLNSGLVPGSSSTVFAQGTPFSPISAAAQALVEVSDGTQNNRILTLRNTTPGHASGNITNGGSNVGQDVGLVWAQNASGKTINAVSNANQALVFNAISAPITTLAWPPTTVVGRLDIGSAIGVSSWNGYVERISFWSNVRLPSSVLTGLTT